MTFKVIAAACMLAVLTGCSSGDTEPLSDLVVIADRDIQGVTVATSKDVIGVDEELTLTATDPVSSADLAGEVDWTSSDTTVATVAEGGTVTGVADGMVMISATIGAFEGSIPLTVSSAGLVSIAVSSTAVPVDVCTGAQLTATGTFADGRTDDVTETVTWASSDPSLADFDTTTLGQLNSLLTGTIDATASQDGVSSAAFPVVINDTLTGITLTAASSTLSVADTSQLTATGNYSTTDREINDAVVFASATEAVATVDTTGLVTGVAEGTSVMSASCAGLSGETTVTVSVTTATLVDLEVVGTQPFSVALGGTIELDVEAEFNDLSRMEVTEEASWTLANGSLNVVSVSNTAGSKGLVTGLQLGRATIQAAYQGELAFIDVDVTPTN
ncbi:MAG: Ig domain-containing protein [Gammaproteobacteria bacterium]